MGSKTKTKKGLQYGNNLFQQRNIESEGGKEKRKINEKGKEKLLIKSVIT